MRGSELAVEVAELRARVTQLELQVTALLAGAAAPATPVGALPGHPAEWPQQPAPWPQQQPADNLAAVYDLVRRGRKIEAIKAYRQATGVSLAEAKDAVERMM